MSNYEVLVPVDVLALLIRDHSFIANGELMCTFCGEYSYHQRDIPHKDTCPILAIKDILSGGKNEK